MAKRVRRQHVVSQFYLKGFANDSSRVARVTLPGDEQLILSTSDAGVIKDFYTITLPDGTRSDAFEHAFSEVEGVAAAALQAIKVGAWPLTSEHRVALSTWIALQHLRSEDIRANQGTMNAEIIRLIVGVSGKEALRQIIEKAENRSVSDEELDWEWEDFTKPGGPDLMPEPHEHLRLLTSLLPQTSEYLHDCHWTLYQFSRRVLVTSDHPVSLVVSPDYPAWRGVGLATADLFLVPLGRRLALTIQPRHRLPAELGFASDFRYPGSTKLARSINQETALRAHRYIYHHPDDAPLDGLFVPEPESHQPRVSNTDGFIHEKGLLHSVTREAAKSAPTARPEDADRGMSIDDLAWPIPGRRTSSKPRFP
ncbi:hypothetical protein amrb99_51700 [Actinomadura sp. RB99]|nr:hypothetical protein [Actinomadura sp. RB99]